jgi:hypothetical protein
MQIDQSIQPEKDMIPEMVFSENGLNTYLDIRPVSSLLVVLDKHSLETRQTLPCQAAFVAFICAHRQLIAMRVAIKWHVYMALF